MDLGLQNILFFARTMGLGGTENVVLQLCEIFKPVVNKIVVCSCGGINEKKLEEMGIKHYGIKDIEIKKTEVLFHNIKEIKRIIKKESITVIHTHHRMAAFYVALLGLYKKCVFINTSHNTFGNKKFLTRFAYSHASLAACGEMVKKNLVDIFEIPDRRITVIHNAVKPFTGRQIADPLMERLYREGKFLIGNIGRLSKQKGMEYYIGAVSAVIGKHPNARFLVIGAGEEEQKLKDMVSQGGLEDSVYFMGCRDDIQNIISQLDLVVLSSLWEGLPLTPIEAFSVGKAVVATAVDGTVEIIEDGKNGFLVEPGNSGQISEKINWIIEHPAERKKMERAAMERYQDEFSFQKLAEGYVKFYEEI